MTERILLTMAIVSIAFGATGRPGAPAGLLVNGVSHPLAIERDATRFTWMSADSSRGAAQTAYQILLSSNAEDLADGQPKWRDRV